MDEYRRQETTTSVSEFPEKSPSTKVIAFASPRLMISDASPMAFAPVAQAETVEKFGPRAPRCSDTYPQAMSATICVITKGLRPFGPLVVNDMEAVFQNVQSARAGAEDHAHVVRHRPDV